MRLSTSWFWLLSIFSNHATLRVSKQPLLRLCEPLLSWITFCMFMKMSFVQPPCFGKNPGGHLPLVNQLSCTLRLNCWRHLPVIGSGLHLWIWIKRATLIWITFGYNIVPLLKLTTSPLIWYCLTEYWTDLKVWTCNTLASLFGKSVASDVIALEWNFFLLWRNSLLNLYYYSLRELRMHK